MRKGIYSTIAFLFLVLPNASYATLSQSSLKSIGKFLITDVQSVPAREGITFSSNNFFVKETGDVIKIRKEEILSIRGLENVQTSFAPGIYRRIIIVNEVSKHGCIVRDAYINERDELYWYDETQSLVKFRKRPELGNTGVMRLMDYENTGVLTDLLKSSVRGSIPTKWKPNEVEIDNYLNSLNVIYKILINRP